MLPARGDNPGPLTAGHQAYQGGIDGICKFDRLCLAQPAMARVPSLLSPESRSCFQCFAHMRPQAQGSYGNLRRTDTPFNPTENGRVMRYYRADAKTPIPRYGGNPSLREDQSRVPKSSDRPRPRLSGLYRLGVADQLVLFQHLAAVESLQLLIHLCPSANAPRPYCNVWRKIPSVLHLRC